MGAILLTLLLSFAAQTPATHSYRHSQCDFSFEYPRAWQIVKNPEHITEDCAVTLRRDTGLSTLTIQVWEGSFLQMAAENGFDFDGKWLVMGRQGSSDEAQISNSNGWLILRGVAEAGCDSGGATVLCEEYRVVAKHKDDDRVVTIVGGAQTGQALELILKTFKLRPR